MKVHHLNCGTMRMPGAPMVCHVLLLETDSGLALVDTGFGLRDIADPGGRIGSIRFVTRPVFDPAETALRQVEALGYAASDVRHIVMTHLDSDHAGGLADFPEAQVHTTSVEWSAAQEGRTMLERVRYRTEQWAHRPKIATHEAGGESWRGFEAAKPLDEIAPGLVMISLPGHTRGHAAYAVDTDAGWVLQAGDMFYHHSTVDGDGRQPLMQSALERMAALDWKRVKANQDHLAELHKNGDADLRIISAHDPAMLVAFLN